MKMLSGIFHLNGFFSTVFFQRINSSANLIALLERYDVTVSLRYILKFHLCARNNLFSCWSSRDSRASRNYGLLISFEEKLIAVLSKRDEL